MGVIKNMKCNKNDHILKVVQFVMQIAAFSLFVYVVTSFVYSANRFDFRLLRESFSEHGGVLQGLPNEVVHVYVLARRAGLDRFDVEGVLLEHPLLSQRVVEFLYPARLEPGARDLFVLEGEAISRECQNVAKSGRVLHFECSNE